MKRLQHILYRSKQQGFTIVELLIVIVIIGILAAIVIVAYNGITREAQTAAITSELKQWAKLFEVYKAANGDYPLPVAPPADPMTSGGPGASIPQGYCLGTGFPQVSGTGYCLQLSSTSGYRIAESTGAYLISQLSTVGTPPRNSAKYTYDSNTGPYATYFISGGRLNVQLIAIYPGGTTCPDSTLAGYSNDGRVHCYVRLSYNS